MAEVWLADDGELDRRVVVKLLAPGADRGRFGREARAVAALGHPNIVLLFDFGDERRPYMVFEYLTGGSLEEQLAASATWPDHEIETIAKDVAEGLAHAHERGVVHRDLKPGNLLFDSDGRAKIADFGIARIQGLDTLTDAGTILGTAAYISPEQVRGEPATPASDVYSFGVILYRLLARRLPFEAESPTELAVLHRDAEPPPLGRVGNQPLAALAMRALAKDPVQRPPDGAGLVAALRGTAIPDVGATTLVLQPVKRRRSRVPLVAGFSAVLVAACGVLAAMLLTSRPSSAPAVPPQSSQPVTRRAPPTTSTARTSTPTTRRLTSTSEPPTTAKTASTRPATTIPLTPPTELSTQLTTVPAPTTALTTTALP
jgi:eukaryotic-like serine/threonine-protein kinase